MTGSAVMALIAAYFACVDCTSSPGYDAKNPDSWGGLGITCKRSVMIVALRLLH